ncbi:putative transcription factor interactor and regulator CCHC(Zn) family [Helianthus annuus]|uniref:Transcription factor interactor and regulator CCHC(Zn) family n=1 Tax=Helianthus annuus TaxID=4232 RepID=A0A9K3HVU3_HELAN|nr:putative transcription factor interactor and regulator CCHC(Zn) family [Helianthus annuus]KAJ0878815.1 putative transcription factor interactor and regulator CCHC(Zn) family [Helianthus annuus]
MNPSWWNPAPDSGKYTSSGVTPSWWGTPAPDSGKYTCTSLSPSWAESPVSTSSQVNALPSNQWALVTGQTPSLQSILLSESETGSLNRPPKLMSLNEYPGWAERFKTYVLGQNTELWIHFTTDFDQAIEVAASETASFADLPEDKKKTYDLEKKAYAILTQALSKDIYHQFVSFKTTKKLWDGLKTRGVGNEATRQLRHDLLKKEFDSFACMDKESLGDMTSRFYHLLTELNNFGVTTTQAEVVKKFADALPPQWSSFLEILKYNGALRTTSFNDFVQLLENKDQEETLKAKRVPLPQNPEMYYGTSSSSSARTGSHAPIQTAFVTSTDCFGNPIQVPVKPPPTTDIFGNPIQPPPPPPAQQQRACYGGTSSADQQSKPNTVQLDTSSFSKVSVEVAKEHMELLNTIVSAYCGLIEGQIGNINLTQEDYRQIDKEEMDLMDIKWAFASAVRRAKDWLECTGRTSLESKRDTKYGFDKQAVKCFNCGERGHFKRECAKPAQHGNQNPFRNQGNQQNQNRNNERTLVPVNNQANRALVVQMDEGCDWSIQFGGDAPNGTACFAQVVKDVVNTSGGESSASGGESSEDEDSSGYSRSVDEDSSGSGDENVSETSGVSADADIDERLDEAAALSVGRSILVDQAACTSSSLHSAFMANVDSSSSQVCVDEPIAVNCDNCDSLQAKCVKLEANMSELQAKHDALQASLFDLQDKHGSLNDEWCALQSKHEALQEKYDVTFIHNQKLTVDLSKCTEANMFYENHEKEFKSMIETLKKDKTELTKMVSRKQTDINLYISRLEMMQKEMACVKTESDAIQLKLDSYLSSSYVLDHIIDVQKEKRDVTCIGYKKCPPPVRHNYDAMPDEEDRVFFEPSVPLDVKEFAAGLGYQKEVSSDSNVSADTSVTAEQKQDPPVEVEDADSSDDESDDAAPAKSDAVVKNEDIPLENHILCDPPVKPAKTVATESSSEKESESVTLLYTLVGDDKIYSDKDFLIKNVNQSLIIKVFENSTSKFLGKKGPRVTVTQCPPIPKAEVRKQFGNKKLPATPKQQNHTKPKGKSPAQVQKKPNQKKKKNVNFVKSTGTDKIETFQNKSNLDFVKQATVLKRSEQNSSKPSTSSSQGSTSSAKRTHDSSGYVERRSCFECGTIGHIIRNCPYLHKQKEKVDALRDHNDRKRSASVRQDPRLVKEREKKQKRQQIKKVEKAIKTDVVQKQSVSVKSANSKTSNCNEIKILKNDTDKTKQNWKPKTVNASGGPSQFTNHQRQEVIVIDENGRPKTTMAWVPLSN